MLLTTYSSQNYASTICQSLLLLQSSVTYSTYIYTPVLDDDVLSEDVKKLMEAARVTRCQVHMYNLLTCLLPSNMCIYIYVGE